MKWGARWTCWGWSGKKKTSNEAIRQILDKTETIMDIIRRRKLYCFSNISVACQMIDLWIVGIAGLSRRCTTEMKTGVQTPSRNGLTDTMWGCSTVTRSCNVKQGCIWPRRSLTKGQEEEEEEEEEEDKSPAHSLTKLVTGLRERPSRSYGKGRTCKGRVIPFFDPRDLVQNNSDVNSAIGSIFSNPSDNSAAFITSTSYHTVSTLLHMYSFIHCAYGRQ